MSLSRCFTLLGDSNVKQNMTSSNCRGRPLMSGAQTVMCGRLATFEAALKSVRSESNVCVVACLTNFLTCGTGLSVQQRVEPILGTFLQKLSDFCETRPSVQFMVHPPMVRSVPTWYRDSLPEVLVRFSAVMKGKPNNVHLLPSFPTPILAADGVHLTIAAGTDYLLHLFEASEEVLDRLVAKPEERATATEEAVRVLSDRMAAVEHGHRVLTHRFELKYAIDSELADFAENTRNETYFMIQGLARLPKMDPKEWQARAKSDVSKAVSVLMGRDIPIEFVQNTTGRGKDSRTLYKVKVQDSSVSKSIRDKFGYYFSGGRDTRPPELAGVSIRNCLTVATLARIAILQLLGKRYQDVNPGSRVQVVGFESRPLIKLTPPPGASDRRVRTFNYIEAITNLPTTFNHKEIDGLLKRISPKLFGSLKSIFVVLDDDMIKKKPQTRRPLSSAPAQAAGSASESESSIQKSPVRSPVVSDRVQARKRSLSGSGSSETTEPATKK